MNNLDGYSDMVQRLDVSKLLLIPPKYTTVTKAGQKTQVQGWSDSGKLKFQQYTQLVKDKKNDDVWITKMRKTVKKKCNKEYKNRNKRKNRDRNDDGDAIKRMNRDEMDKWNTFLSDTVNNDDWYTQSVPV